MANINFTGFVEKELTNSRGEQFGFTIAEPHRKKQDDGSEVVGLLVLAAVAVGVLFLIGAPA